MRLTRANAIKVAPMRGDRFFASRKHPRRVHQASSELDQACVTRTEIFTGPIGDNSLTLACRRVLVANAFNSREGDVSLFVAVDEIVVFAVGHRNYGSWDDVSVRANPCLELLDFG